MKGKLLTCIGHRRFPKRNHPCHRLKKTSNGSQEDKIASPPLTGQEVYNRVCNVNVTFGKTFGRRNPYSLNFHIGQSLMLGIP